MRENKMGDSRDIQNGVLIPSVGRYETQVQDNQTPHERAQTAADVRANACRPRMRSSCGGAATKTCPAAEQRTAAIERNEE